jgi:uncharacterized protein (DUF433 family)
MEEHKDLVKRVSDDGICRNGVSVVTLIRFIRAYDFEARIDDVAGYFRLDGEDVAAALAFYSANFERLHPLVVAGE